MEIQVMEDILGKNDQIAMENQVLFKKEQPGVSPAVEVLYA